jgi:hypothetical protein
MESIMSKTDDDLIPSIWRLQPVPKVELTPELIRARATKFERQVRNRIRFEVVSSLALVPILAFAALRAHGMVLRAGFLLMAAFALVGAYLIGIVGRLGRSPGDPSASAAWYIKNLEGQSRYWLAAPWGAGLAMPGFILFLIGSTEPLGRIPWQHSIIQAGVAAFLYVAYVIYGKLLASSWQQEIESLRSLRGH